MPVPFVYCETYLHQSDTSNRLGNNGYDDEDDEQNVCADKKASRNEVAIFVISLYASLASINTCIRTSQLG